jgi:hypothetical protein
MDEIDIQKFIIIKRDVTDLRKLILDNNNVNEWNKMIILYTIFLIYQHVFATYTMMNKVMKHDEFNFKRDFKNLYMLFFFICNLRVSYLYMIKSVLKVDKELAVRLHSTMGEYFSY